MQHFILQTLVITFMTCAATLLADALLSVCRYRQPQADENWKPFGIYKGHLLYERTYESGKKSWRYEDEDGYIYMGASTVENENIEPL
jgi:hypothetical protein